MADAEEIRNPIHAFLPVQCSMCEMVRCHHEKRFFLLQMWPFLPDFVKQSIQEFSIICCSNCLSFLKLVMVCAYRKTLAIILPADCCVFGRFDVFSPGLTHCFDLSCDSGI